MTSISSLGSLGALVTEQAKVKERLDKLTRQASSGKIADDYAGLGATATRRSIDLRAESSRRSNYSVTITRTQGRLDSTQSVLSRLQSIAQTFSSTSIGVLSGNPEQVQVGAQQARDALKEVASLLNTTYDGEYVFGGQDSANPPIPNPTGILSSGMFTQISAEVSSLTASNGASVIANTRAIAASDTSGVTVFSAYVSDPATGASEARRTFQADDGLSVPIGVFANRNTSAASTGASTTGSWAKDLLRGLSVLASLDSSKASMAPGFNELVSDVTATLRSANTTLASESGSLGATQKMLSDRASAQTSAVTLLNQQVGNVEDVDLADVVSRLNLVTTQLQASYRLLGNLGQMSLASFLR